MPTETILNGSCRQHDFGTPPEPALTAPHQAISRVCWFVAFLHVTFVQKIWTAQNFGVFCSALNSKSALETKIPAATTSNSGFPGRNYSPTTGVNTVWYSALALG